MFLFIFIKNLVTISLPNIANRQFFIKFLDRINVEFLSLSLVTSDRYRFIMLFTIVERIYRNLMAQNKTKTLFVLCSDHGMNEVFFLLVFAHLNCQFSFLTPLQFHPDCVHRLEIMEERQKVKPPQYWFL